MFYFLSRLHEFRNKNNKRETDFFFVFCFCFRRKKGERGGRGGKQRKKTLDLPSCGFNVREKAEDRQKKRIKVAEALANRSSRDERAGETGGSKKGKTEVRFVYKRVRGVGYGWRRGEGGLTNRTRLLLFYQDIYSWGDGFPRKDKSP